MSAEFVEYYATPFQTQRLVNDPHADKVVKETAEEVFLLHYQLSGDALPGFRVVESVDEAGKLAGRLQFVGRNLMGSQNLVGWEG